MVDTSIRRLTLAEEAQALARQAVETQTEQPNPYKGKPEEAEFWGLYLRHLFEASAAADTEAGA